MDESHLRFIDHARLKGLDQGTIFPLLQASGWKEKDIAEAGDACSGVRTHRPGKLSISIM